MKKIIFVPYCEDTTLKTGSNMTEQSNRFDIYMKNCCVSCLSAKTNNPHTDVALVTNTVVPQNYEKLLLDNDVLIIKTDFIYFRFPKNYRWGLAFYKLCALKYVVDTYDYDYYSYLDADTFVQDSFENIWAECNNNILLYDINHGLQVPNYRNFLLQIEKFCSIDECVTQYGGEFFAASQENAKLFINQCLKIYEDMLKKNFETTSGDEFITALSAFHLRNKIRNAGAYIYRFWTGTFRLVSTQYEANAVVVLRVPDEKTSGILKLYNYFVRKHKFPTSQRIHRILHLKYPRLRTLLRRLLR